VTDLPEPDSPTTHSVWPAWMSKLTSCTTCWVPPVSRTPRLRMLRTGGSGILDTAGHLGIEGVTQGVTQQVHTEYGQRQEESRHQDELGLHAEIHAPFGDDVAPRGNLGRHAHAQKAHDGFGQDGRGEDEGALH